MAQSDLYLDQFYKSYPYQVKLKNDMNGQTYIGYLTQPMNVRVGSNYETLISLQGNAAANFAAGFLPEQIQGRVGSTNVLDFTYQAWTGTEVPEFSIQMAKLAIGYGDDVVADAKNLLKWPLPPKISHFLQQPASINKYCTMQIGNGGNEWLRIDHLYPVNVDVNFSPLYDRTEHHPVRIEITMSFTYYRIPTAEDVERWFPSSGLRSSML